MIFGFGRRAKMFNREINRIEKSIAALVRKSREDEIMVIADVVEAVSSAIKEGNPKFDEKNFYARIIPRRYAVKHAMLSISRIAQEEGRDIFFVTEERGGRGVSGS